MAQQTALMVVSSSLRFADSLVSRVQHDGTEKSAWRTCLFFYSQAAFRLNRSLDSSLGSTADDVQTWLSAAASNIRACHGGFFDVNVTSDIFPLVMLNNVTELISNCLAVNFGFLRQEGIRREGVIKKFSERELLAEKLLLGKTRLHAFGKAAFEFLPETQSQTDKVLKKDGALMKRADCVVAQDGSGNFRTIREALQAAGRRTRRISDFVIRVKQGVYSEIVEVRQSNIVLIGDGVGKTVVTGNRRVADGFTLYESATFKVSGDGFKAVGMTFENTAGVAAGQAVAMASTADRSVFYRCSFKGYQDTLLAQSNRQFYKNCQIYGTVDFIFGNAAAVFQDCTIHLRKPQPGGGLVVTAQDRNGPHENTGFTIHRGRVMAAPDLAPFPQIKAFLGRPWGDFSRTVYLRSTLDTLVDPAGWLAWGGAPPRRCDTLDYGEFENHGTGASTHRRVKWRGYRVIRDRRTAEAYDVDRLINGKVWLPGTGVPFDADF
ncbi:pectinesterase [Daucus carota subsp. sativus]|uniref:pectinesterase n=1 Tax=Daucus carota subsp. sativus TaxID=79200 RepID=UPI0007EF07BF|nr:PREDICTED: pectinesterase-like [Daucus carota subsp. sativus]